VTALALLRLVLFWGALAWGAAKLVARAYDAGRRRELRRCRDLLARRRKGRALPLAEEV